MNAILRGDFPHSKMNPLKILIADDSVVYRSQIKSALGNTPQVEVVGSSPNGRLALDRLTQQNVDLLILDLEMPEMDGLQTLLEIRRLDLKCKVIVFSSASKRGSEITLEALRLGASDFVTKPGQEDTFLNSGLGGDPALRIKEVLLPRILSLFKISDESTQNQSGSGSNKEQTPSNSSFPRVIWNLHQPKIVVIGSSTGGPNALEKIFSGLKGPVTTPILIAQHMPPLFTATLAARLSKISGIPAKEATHGEVLEGNRIYIAPGDFHFSVGGSPDRPVAILNQDPKIHSVRPAVDPLFASAALLFKDQCLGIVLTGMGFDGKCGAENIKNAGGAVVIQDEASCVVFGMPGAVYASGAFDRIGNLEEILKMLNEKISSQEKWNNGFLGGL